MQMNHRLGLFKPKQKQGEEGSHDGGGCDTACAGWIVRSLDRNVDDFVCGGARGRSMHCIARLKSGCG